MKSAITYPIVSRPPERAFHNETPKTDSTLGVRTIDIAPSLLLKRSTEGVSQTGPAEASRPLVGPAIGGMPFANGFIFNFLGVRGAGAPRLMAELLWWPWWPWPPCALPEHEPELVRKALTRGRL